VRALHEAQIGLAMHARDRRQAVIDRRQDLAQLAACVRRLHGLRMKSARAGVSKAGTSLPRKNSCVAACVACLWL
jgi:hypothetical protein